MYNKLQAFDAIHAVLSGTFDNEQLMKLGALHADRLDNILSIVKATDTNKFEEFDNQQIQALLDNNQDYDMLLFVQIPRTYFHKDLLSYMELRATFQSRGKDSEFMFMAHKLKEAIEYFDRWKDKTISTQCRKLDKDLSSVQYIHVID